MNTTAHALVGSVLAGAPETASLALVEPRMLPPGLDRLWETIRGAWADGLRPSPETLLAARPDDGNLILDCVHASVNPAEADYLASSLLASHDRSQLQSHLIRCQQLLDGDGSTEEVAALLASPPRPTVEPQVTPIGDALDDWISAPADRGVTSPWQSVNETLTLMRAGGLHIVGARPAVGKTLYALMLARGVAQSGTPVRYVSLEMTARELSPRLIAQQARMPLDAVEARGGAGAEDRARVGAAIRDLRALPLTIDDEAAQTVEQVTASARAAHHKGELGCLIIDHMQLLEPSDRRLSLRESVTAQSRALKALAMSLDIPVIALSQLSRAPAGEERPPRMSDLRESGSIEQDADTVTLLSMPVTGGDEDRTRLLVEVAKNRSGRTGAALLSRRPEMATLEDLSRGR